MKLFPPSGSTLEANGMGKVTQQIRLVNTLQGQKPLMMKLKITFNKSGEPITEQSTISSFPDNM